MIGPNIGPAIRDTIIKSMTRWAEEAEAAAKRAEDRAREADLDMVEHVLASPDIDAGAVVKGTGAHSDIRLDAGRARAQATVAKQAVNDAKRDLGAAGYPGPLLGHALKGAHACQEAKAHTQAAEARPLPSTFISQG